VVHTNLLAQPRRQHVDVATCSLHPETLNTFPASLVFVSDTSYYKVYPQEARQYLRYPLRVPCRKSCLAILNKAADSSWADRGRAAGGMLTTGESSTWRTSTLDWKPSTQGAGPGTLSIAGRCTEFPGVIAAANAF
jgi:hypothetical protein